MPNSPPKRNPDVRQTLGGDLTPGWDSTDRVGLRIEGYSTLKERTLEFVDWALDGGIPQFTRDNTKLFRKLDNCGSYLIFRNYIKAQRSRLIGACSCKEHLLCAFCAARRGVRNAVAYRERVDLLIEEKPAQRLMFATFTVVNGDDLWERFTHLRSSMQTLLKNRNYALKRGSVSSFSFAHGGVFAYEFKKGSGSGKWHPHIHMLLLVDSGAFPDVQKVKDEWLDITGDSSVVNLKPCTDDAAFLEVFAYALKFSEMSNQDRWFAFNQLKGERLISSFGSLRGVEVPESLSDDLIDDEKLWVDVLYRYSKWIGYSSGLVVGSSSPGVMAGAQLARVANSEQAA